MGECDPTRDRFPPHPPLFLSPAPSLPLLSSLATRWRALLAFAKCCLAGRTDSGQGELTSSNALQDSCADSVNVSVTATLEMHTPGGVLRDSPEGVHGGSTSRGGRPELETAVFYETQHFQVPLSLPVALSPPLSLSLSRARSLSLPLSLSFSLSLARALSLPSSLSLSLSLALALAPSFSRFLSFSLALCPYTKKRTTQGVRELFIQWMIHPWEGYHESRRC